MHKLLMMNDLIFIKFTMGINDHQRKNVNVFADSKLLWHRALDKIHSCAPIAGRALKTIKLTMFSIHSVHCLFAVECDEDSSL